MTTEKKPLIWFTPSRTIIAGVVLLAIIAGGAIAASLLFPSDGKAEYQSAYVTLAADQNPAVKPYADQQRPQQLHMQLEGQFAGPLKDTIIQRWRDPVDGTVCYIYLPVVVPHAPGPSGYVQYGANAIGSISCIPSPKRR